MANRPNPLHHADKLRGHKHLEKGPVQTPTLRGGNVAVNMTPEQAARQDLQVAWLEAALEAQKTLTLNTPRIDRQSLLIPSPPKGQR